MIESVRMFAPTKQYGNNAFTEVCKDVPHPGMYLPIKDGIRNPKTIPSIFNIPVGCDTPEKGEISGNMNRRPDDSLICYLA